MIPSEFCGPSQLDLAESFADVAASLLVAADLGAAFISIVDLGIKTVAGAEHAGVTMLRRGKFETPVASSDLPRRVDAIQYDLGGGPCVDAVLQNTTCRTGDLSVDPRWPEFGARAVTETGIISVLSFRLFLEDDDALAGLNFYSSRPDAFDENTTLTGGVFATHAALALAAAGRKERIANLEQALASNREIGVAMGILMATQFLTRQQAFDLLRVASQMTHRKLRDIALDVTNTGGLSLRAT